MNNVNEFSVAASQTRQRFAFVEAWIGRIQAGDTRQQFFRFVIQRSASCSNDVCAQTVPNQMNVFNWIRSDEDLERFGDFLADCVGVE